MNVAGKWVEVFKSWPAGAPSKGVVVTTFGEQIAFNAFRVSDAFLLIDRQAPDTLGSRQVMLPYEQIVALKITEVFRPEFFDGWGFGRVGKSSSTVT